VISSSQTINGFINGSISSNASILLTLDSVQIHGSLNSSSNVLFIGFLTVNEDLILHNSNFLGFGNLIVGNSVVLLSSTVQLKNSVNVSISNLNGSSSEVQMKNLTNVETKGGVDTKEVSFEFHDIKSTTISGDSKFDSSTLSTNSNITVTGNMNFSSSNMVTTLNSIFSVQGNANLKDSVLTLNVAQDSDIGEEKVVMSSSQGINGQFSSIVVNDTTNRLTSDCEKLQASPSYSDGTVLSVIVKKDSSGCSNQPITNGASGVEIAMLVLIIIFGVGIIAASVFFIIFRQNKYKSTITKLSGGSTRTNRTITLN